MTQLMPIDGRTALVVGLARTGAATAKFLAARGATVTVSEARPEQDVALAVTELRAQGIQVECGGHREESFRAADLIVPSPGVPFTIPPLQKAIRRGVEIISELELACRFLRGRTVAVTGSNGKTTTTTLLGRIFAQAGLPTQVGGNIGTPLISLVESSTPGTINVVEVSSFQLEAVVSFRPSVGVLLNLTPDHLDRHASMQEYATAKARLFAQQGPDEFAVLNADDPAVAGFGEFLHAQVYWFSRTRPVRAGSYLRSGQLAFVRDGLQEQVLDRDEIRIRGEHNLENVLAAVCAARLLDAPVEAIRAAVAGFEGVEHRLEFVAELEGVRYYNDSKATNVDSALKAIESFSGNLIVILGGKDKGGDFAPLRDALRQRARLVLLVGAAREKVAEQLGDAVAFEKLETIPEAVARAAGIAAAGDTVLLAPACASFDQFESFEHRGCVFKDEVRRLHAVRQEH